MNPSSFPPSENPLLSSASPFPLVQLSEHAIDRCWWHVRGQLSNLRGSGSPSALPIQLRPSSLLALDALAIYDRLKPR